MRRNRWTTAAVIMLVVASGILAPLGAGRASAQNATVTPRTGPGDGGSYESPTYGYTLSYDAVVWTVSAEDEDLDDGYDQIALTNGSSYITLIGTTDWQSDQLTECVEDYAAFRAETDGISDFDPVAGSDDEDDGSDSNLYTYTYNDGEFTEYLECRDLETAVVIILHDVASDAYEDEVEARDDLLDGLEPGDAPEPTATPKSGSKKTPVSMGTPGKKETPESEEGVYTSPSYDYVIPYGDDWQVTSEDSDDGIDLLEITNDISVVTFTGVEASGDAESCLSAAVDALLAEDEYQDFNQAVTGDNTPYEGDGVLGPYTGYTDGDTAVYLECGLSPDGDVAVLVRVVSPLTDFGNEIGPISDILDAITWESGSSRATATPDEEASPTEEPSPESENSYVDQENQWSLTWDDSWDLTSDPEEDGLLILDNGVSLVYVIVIPDTDDAQDCLSDQVALLTDDENVSDVSRLRIDGATVRGGDETAAYSAYTYTYEGDNGSSDQTTYFDCRVLPDGENALLINQIVTADAYESETAEITDLLDGLTIGDQSGPDDPDPTEEPDATATPDDTETDENSYTNETYNYSITWDDTWTREETDDEDVLQLTNGTSTATLLTYDDGDAEACVEGSFRTQSRTYDDLEIALDTEDKPLEGGDASSAFGVYVGTDSNGDSVVISFFCISIGSDVSVVFQHLTTPDAYNDEIEARSALLDALVLP